MGPRRVVRIWLVALTWLCFATAVYLVKGARDDFLSLMAARVLPTITLNEAGQFAASSAADWSNKILDYSMILVGALWALVLAGKSDVRITLRDLPEIQMLVLANLLLAGSIYCYYMQHSLMDEIMLRCARIGGTQRSVVDFSQPRVANLAALQFRLFITGSLASVATLFSTSRLRATPTQP
jgi:hypothetical protein